MRLYKLEYTYSLQEERDFTNQTLMIGESMMEVLNRFQNERPEWRVLGVVEHDRQLDGHLRDTVKRQEEFVVGNMVQTPKKES